MMAFLSACDERNDRTVFECEKGIMFGVQNTSKLQICR